MKGFSMQITGKKPATSLDTYIKNIDAQKKLKQPLSQPAGVAEKEGDTVALSAEAKQIQAASKLLQSMPEIREETVANIRSQIESGTYQINPGKIAAAILKDALSDEIT